LALKDLNGVLEQILHLQFGINDKEWVDAMSDLEQGFGRAIGHIAKQRGFHLPKVPLMNADIDRILKVP
jgi:hypothetical protein